MPIPESRPLTRAILAICLAASCQPAGLSQNSLVKGIQAPSLETIHTTKQPNQPIPECAPPATASPTQPEATADSTISVSPTTPPTPPADTTATEQETKDAERQLDNSPPAGTRLQPLPQTGKIITSREQKRAAAAASMRILSHGPELKIPAFTESGRPTICLALGGGGIRGAAHIGVMKVLEREGIPIDCIVGNSMGAIVGGLYSAGVSLDRIQELLADGDLKKAYANMVPPKVMITPIEMLLNPLHKHYAGLYSGKRFGKWLDSVLPEENMNVQDTKIPFCAVATNLLDGQAYKISEGRLSTVIKASSSLAPLLRPVPLGDKLYMDGGLRANLPAKAGRETGAGFVLGVLVDEPLGKLAPKTFMHLKKLTARMVDIVLATADERQLQFADVVINPDVSGIAVLSKRRADVEKAVRNGELAAEKALPNIRQQLNRLSSSLAAGASTHSTSN